MKLVIASLLVMSLLLFGCTVNNGPAPEGQGNGISISTNANVTVGTPPAQQPPAPQPASSPTPVPSATQSAVKEFTMTAKQWEFQPSTITVKRGDHVKLTIRSTDVAHGFGLPDFGVSSRLEPGQDTVVEFDADKTGTFTFRCSVFCGSGHGGMSGQLVVTEN